MYEYQPEDRERLAEAFYETVEFYHQNSPPGAQLAVRETGLPVQSPLPLPPADLDQRTRERLWYVAQVAAYRAMFQHALGTMQEAENIRTRHLRFQADEALADYRLERGLELEQRLAAEIAAGSSPLRLQLIEQRIARFIDNSRT